MIIGAREQIFDGEAFAAGASRALRGVVRVSFGPREGNSFCTGWMLTPRLVIVPGYVATRPTDVDPGASLPMRVQAMKNGRVAWQEEVTGEPEWLGPGLVGASSPKGAIALLRLRTPRPNREIALSFETPEPGCFLSLLHFAGGRLAVCVSFGRLTAIGEPLLTYDADTLPGSGGAPVLDERWRLVAMHLIGNQGGNQGLSRAALVEALQRSVAWPEIAKSHRIADVAAGRQQLQAETEPSDPSEPKIDRLLVRAALSASVNPRSLSADKAELLRPHVVNPSAKKWVLQPSVRQSVLRSVGSLEKLRKRLPAKRGPKDASRRVVERILAGPPYDLASEDEESLSWWIQASRWFAGVAPSLPKPAEITRALERRRMRGRLEAIAGPGFRGRAGELSKLRKWFQSESPGPLSVTGIGGVGKSALVARFASELPADTLLLWLDFDRADLAPDDAVSVLAALGEQAAVQLEGFEAPVVTESGWPAAARELAGRLASHLASAPPSLLVLDSFEVAQFAQRHEELWPVLETVAKDIPALRLVVTGRAPVERLSLLGRPAKSMHLEGIEDDVARDWLREKGVTRPDILKRVVELADGIPLILRLALQLVQAGGRVEDLPDKLPPEIVAGFLYDRILDRVQNPALKEVAAAALVLRRLTADMVEPVLGGLVDFPAGDPAVWFAELGREMALVEGTDVLRLRPEVRSATLKLLEHDRSDLVRAVDERAERWYAQRDTNDPEMAAELVYHRLRLGNVASAAAAWRDGCGSHLQYAAEELAPKARKWLRERLGTQNVEATSLPVWEQEAAERIRSSRSRGLKRAVSKILDERAERSDDSPLVFQEAFELRADGGRDAALARLDEAGDASGPMGRDRTVLRALLAADAGDRQAADRYLAAVDGESFWADRQRGPIEALAVRAARVRLASDLDTELKLLQTLWDGEVVQEASGAVRRFLSPMDVLLPHLVRQLSAEGRIETVVRWTIPEDSAEMSLLAAQIEAKRRETLPDEPQELRTWRQPPGTTSSPGGRPDSVDSWEGPGVVMALELMELGWRRWSIAATTPFLADACRLAQSSAASGDPLATSVLGSLALFVGPFRGLLLASRQVPVFEFLQRATSHGLLRVSQPVWERALSILLAGVTPDVQWLSFLPGDFAKEPLKPVPAERILYGWKAEPRARALAFHLLAPDPLERLVQSLAGETDTAP
jgi:hypothetical protein